MNSTMTTSARRRTPAAIEWRLALVGALMLGALVVAGDEQPAAAKPDGRSTAPSLERQLDAPASSSSSPPVKATEASAPAVATGRAPHKPQKPAASMASQKKAAASQASAQNYDKYQLKASSSAAAGAVSAASKATESPAAAVSSAATTEASSSAAATPAAHKKAAGPVAQKSSSFALLRKFLPSFMTSAAAAAAASAAVSGVPGGAQHSRSSPAAADSPVALASGRIINLLSASLGGGAAKKRGHAHYDSAAIPNHAPFFMRKSAADRQAVGGAAALASGLLSNPLKLGLLFSAPLLPSLLLTPLALAGLSPAMSAINNFFDDDDEPAAAAAAAGQPSGPLAALAQGPNSPLASILQATGMSRFQPTPAPASGQTDSGAPSTGSALALQAFQSLLMGPTSTTERPLFNPGMFASSGAGAVQQAMGSIASSLGQQSSSSQASGSGSGSGSSQAAVRPMFGGGLMQTAASMISPSFAAPPQSGSDDDQSGNNSGIMAMASEVFEKVANYMGQDNGAKNSASVSQASGGGQMPSGQSAASSPLATLATLSSLSPFQLSSLFAPTPFGSAAQQASTSASGPAGPSGNTQRAGFFSTLRNVYELFSSSFLRRQEVAGESANECQQRLVCELHQRAMSSKLFRRSLQSNLMELANLDRNLLEQIKFAGSGQAQARVDPDTRAMLSDFLKASNNFKQGREMINCGQMFPKCSRVQLLAAANAHLNDPANGRTLGKFSQLMKKMKFKSQQQHQSQWKLRKPNKSSTLAAGTRTTPALDYLQVAPLGAQKSAPALAPVDSLKLAQQLLYLSQMSNQPQQQQQQINAMASGQFVQQQQQQQQQQQPSVVAQQQQQQQSIPISNQQQVNYEPAVNYGQYSGASAKQTTYTDADTPLYSSAPPQPSAQQLQYSELASTSYNGNQQQYQSSYQNSYTPEPQQAMTSVAGVQQQVAPLEKQPAKQMALAGH